MAAPAESLPRIRVQKLIVDRTEGPLTLDSARKGIKGFNAKCPHKTMTLAELLDVMRIVSDLGATDTTATFQLDEKMPSRTWSINAVKPEAATPADGAPQPQPYQFTSRQQALAEGVMVEVIGNLAKNAAEGTDLNQQAIKLVKALQAGFSQINQCSPTPCNN